MSSHYNGATKNTVWAQQVVTHHTNTDPADTAHETTTIIEAQVHDNTEIQMLHDPKEDAERISEHHD